MRIASITSLAICISGFFVNNALTQESKPAEEVVASFPMLNNGEVSPIRVTKIDAAAGTAILSPSGQIFFGLANIPQGEVLLLVQNEQSKEIVQMIRARIDEILEKGEVVAKLGKEAARAIRPGPIFPIQPIDGLADLQNGNFFPLPSRKFKQLPEVVSFGEAAGEQDQKSVNRAMSAARQAAYQAQSVNNLKQIALALHNFESANGHFPPAVIYGPDGKPWHSWRTLILPYLEQGDLYNKYDFSQPWDAPANKAVVETVVEVYKDPVYGKSKEAVAHYAALVGKDAAFLPDGAIVGEKNSALANMTKGARKFTAFTDGTSNTVMVAPVADERKIPWAKPEDIHYGPDFPLPGKPGGLGMPYASGDGKYRYGPVAFVDGSVRSLRDDTDFAMLKALITIAGGELIDYEKIPNPAPGRQSVPVFKLIRKADGSFTGTFE